MAFWGVEVKSGKPVIYKKARGRLRISQATLGISDASEKSILQCNIGNRSPVLLCALLPNQIESCHLELEFEEADDVVFSVIGPRSVHLTGYYITQSEQPSPGPHTNSGYNGMDIKHTSHTPRSQLAHPGMTSDCFIASRSSWIVDSGATDHMTGNKSILSELATTSQPPVQIANGSTCKIDGVGCTQLSPNMPLSSVLYVPSFPENLMSVSKITEQLNCSVTFTPTKCIFQELGTNRLIGTAYKEQGLYYMESSPQRVAYLSTRSAQEVHYQLGHPSLRICILVAGALGGRFDHEVGNINVLCRFSSTRIVLLSDDCLIQLLPRSHHHEIHVQHTVEGPHCGIVPIGGPSKSNTTTGLKWNLCNTEMKFGGVISTSNIVTGEIVSVRSDSDLLWTVSLKQIQ